MTDGQKPHNKPQYGEVMHHSCCIHCCPTVVAAAAAAAAAASAVVVVSVLVSFSLLCRVYTVVYVSPFLSEG